MEFSIISSHIFFIIIFFFFSNFQSVKPFSPTDHYLLDCGSEVNTVIDNRDFISDSHVFGPIVLSATPKISVKNQNPSQDSSILYDTARIFTKPSHYEFKIKKKGIHLIRLHFSPFNSPQFNLSDAQFCVAADGFVLFNDISPKNPILKEYLISIESDRLVISFTPWKQSFGYVNALEVISAPEDLVVDTASFADSQGTGKFHWLTKQVLETVYRINVGGSLVTPFNDSLWRTWIPDDGFVKLGDSGSKRVSFSGRIKYQIGGASREVAPDSVYNTGRVIMNKQESNIISWIFPVLSSGINNNRCLVRLHFCDIASKVLNQLYFNVYINGYFAYEDFDVSELASQTLSSPFYVDFVVDAGNSGGILNVSIGPSNLSRPDWINGILNGVEIFKMNGTVGSLSGVVSAESLVSDQRPRGKVGFFMPAIAAVSLLIAAALFVHKRSKLKDSVAWSRLSVEPSKDSSKHENHRLLSDKLDAF